MKHATGIALEVLEPLLRQLRAIDGLIEKRRGVFYRKSRAFLHFHEDAAGFFADVRVGHDWQRFPASNPSEQRTLINAVREELRATA